MKVEVHRDKCRGYANCVIAAPGVFSVDDEDVVVLLDAEPGPDQERAVENAVRDCPVSAITARKA